MYDSSDESSEERGKKKKKAAFVDLELAAKKKPPCSTFGKNMPHLPAEVCNRIFAYIAANKKTRRETFRNLTKTHFAVFNALWGSYLKIPRPGNIHLHRDYGSKSYPEYFRIVKLTEKSVRVLPLRSTVVKEDYHHERQSRSIVYMPGDPEEGAKAKTVGRKKFYGCWERWQERKKAYWHSSDP
ncbi:hypothetical protein HDV00_006013 [Rhizophlyctis rosea]|nr:hypothetical protein HDV00_006013 [Rhizophlyctis rosea]